MLNRFNAVNYAVFFDLMEDSSVDILLVTDKHLASGETSTQL